MKKIMIFTILFLFTSTSSHVNAGDEEIIYGNVYNQELSNSQKILVDTALENFYKKVTTKFTSDNDRVDYYKNIQKKISSMTYSNIETNYKSNILYYIDIEISKKILNLSESEIKIEKIQDSNYEIHFPHVFGGSVNAEVIEVGSPISDCEVLKDIDLGYEYLNCLNSSEEYTSLIQKSFTDKQKFEAPFILPTTKCYKAGDAPDVFYFRDPIIVGELKSFGGCDLGVWKEAFINTDDMLFSIKIYLSYHYGNKNEYYLNEQIDTIYKYLEIKKINE